MTIKKCICVVLSLISMLLPVTQAAGETEAKPEIKYIAVIIDDFGNNANGTKEMLALTIPFTAAVMPNMPQSMDEAELLHNAGKGVMLHMPMEADSGPKSWMGKGGITSDLKGDEIRLRVADALDQLKYAEAINNHMGSKITKDEKIMEEIIAVVKERDLIIVDSKTTGKSKVKDVAEKNKVKHMERNVFLDGKTGTNSASVEKRMYEAGEMAKKYGYAIAIGHVGPAGGVATAKGIANAAPKLMKDGVMFVTVKELYDILYGLKSTI